MKRWAQSVFLLLGTLLIAGCATAPTGDHSGAEASAREAMSGFMGALNKLDLEGMAAYFADDITAFVPLAQADRVNGKPAVVEIFRKYVETTRKTTAQTHIVPEDLRVDASGDTAIVTFNVRNEGAVFRRTFVFRERDGRWLIVHFHASNFQAKP